MVVVSNYARSLTANARRFTRMNVSRGGSDTIHGFSRILKRTEQLVPLHGGDARGGFRLNLSGVVTVAATYDL